MRYQKQISEPLIVKKRKKAVLFSEESICITCGHNQKHLLHMQNDLMQPFLFWSCGSDVPRDKLAKGVILKFVIYFLMTPVIAALVSIYYVHLLMVEFYFDFKWVRLVTAKGQIPLWKRFASLLLFLLGVGIYLLLQFVLAPVLWWLFVPALLYLQPYSYMILMR